MGALQGKATCSTFASRKMLWDFGAHQGGHATARFLEGVLEQEVLLRRFLRRRLVRASIERQRFLEGFLEGSLVS